MGLWIGGKSSGTSVEVGYNWKSMNVSRRPIDIAGLGLTGGIQYGGFYRLANIWNLSTATALFTANVSHFSFRWGHPTLNCAILALRYHAQCLSLGTTITSSVDWGWNVARNWTTADSGGTVITFALDAQKQKVSLANTGMALGNCNYPTTAALTAGTRTLDTQPMTYKGFHQEIIVAGAAGLKTTLDGPQGTRMRLSNETPIILTQNEGIILKCLTTVATTVPVVRMGVEICWAELPYGVI